MNPPRQNRHTDPPPPKRSPLHLSVNLNEAAYRLHCIATIPEEQHLRGALSQAVVSELTNPEAFCKLVEFLNCVADEVKP